MATSLSSLSSEPAALLEILGEPILHRMVEALRRNEVDPIFLVVDRRLRDCDAVRSLKRERIHVLSGSAEGLPALVESAVKRCADLGVANVVLMETSAYVELNVQDFVDAHESGNQRITLAYDEFGALPVAMVDSAEGDLAGSLIQRKLLLPEPTARYLHRGYVNLLRTAHDLRRLAQDALQHRSRIRPNGDEVRPGVWVSRTSFIHPTARLTGPAYLGPNSRLRSGAVISECSTIERDCIVERGTVVQDSSVLSGTYLGVGLDVSHTVIKRNKLLDVQRNVGIDIAESLIGATPLSPKRIAPGLWASLAGKGESSLRNVRGRLRTLLPKPDASPVAPPSRVAYSPADSWATLKSLSRTDSTSI